VKRQSRSPAIAGDFPDPSVIQANNNWYAYATNNNQFNVQLARSAQFSDGWGVLSQDALPTLASWAQAPVWAPDVSQRVSRDFLQPTSARCN
jgi:beta-xylosidase